MKRRIKPSSILLNILDLAEDLLFLASRPGMQRMTRYWGYTEMREAYRAFQRWEAEEYVEKVRQGEQILYRVGRKGKELLLQRRPSSTLRNRSWDGNWRMVVFDFPEVAKKARDAFRRQLHHQRLGCLQKSVWITPDPVIPEWKRFLRESDLKEWVLLFESAELGPVDDVEIARKVWSLDELADRYRKYLSNFGALRRQLQAARAPALDGELGRLIRRESGRYFELLEDDPMLPRVLLPSNFPGAEADALHGEIRAHVRESILSEKP